MRKDPIWYAVGRTMRRGCDKSNDVGDIAELFLRCNPEFKGIASEDYFSLDEMCRELQKDPDCCQLSVEPFPYLKVIDRGDRLVIQSELDLNEHQIDPIFALEKMPNKLERQLSKRPPIQSNLLGRK